MNRELIFENTWVVEDSGVRIFILRGTEKTLVIDTGRSGLDIRGCLEDDRPCELLNTHADGDHIAGNRFFPVFFMHPSEAPVYYKLNKGERSFLPVYDGDQMDLGGRPLEIVHIPGHTPGSISVLDRRARCLIGGDPIQTHGQIYMFYPSHADLPVDKAEIPELIAGAESILRGTAAGRSMIVHGKEVTAYDVGANVLLCDPVL